MTISTPRRRRSPAVRSADGSSPVTSMMRGGLVPSGVTALVVALVAGMVSGWAGAFSALVGSAVVVGLFASGLLVLPTVLGGPVATAMSGALLVYLVQMSGMFLLLLGLRTLDGLDSSAFGLAALITVVVWQIGQVVGLTRARQLRYPEAQPVSGGQ